MIAVGAVGNNVLLPIVPPSGHIQDSRENLRVYLKKFTLF